MRTRQLLFYLAVLTAAIFTMVSPRDTLAQNAPERVSVIISFAHTPGSPEQALVQGIGGTIKHSYTLVPAIAASLPASALIGLSKSPKIVAIEPDGTFQANDFELDNTWGVKRIGAGTVHDGGNKGFGVNVAVLDSGIDYMHSDLDGNFAGGFDFVNNDNDPKDDFGHGTHVSGTVCAEDNDTGVVGVAPEVNLYAVKVLGPNGSGSFSDVIAGLQWCVDNGIQVTNNSYGSSQDPGAAVKAAFDNSYAAGIIHISSAGNTGNRRGKGDNVEYPANYDSVIAVASTRSNDKRSGFSSTGPAVEMAAPGSTINSTLMGGGYGTASGTSMASPHVAGVAALVIAAGMTDNDDVRAQLQVTAEDLGDAGLDPLFGYGLVDADEAVNVGDPNDAPVVTMTSPTDGATFTSGASISFTGSASDTEDGTITANMVWTSSIDGQIGTGGSFSATLNDGVHTITARVTDSGGKTGSSSVSITVGNLPPGPTDVIVTSITYSTSGGKGGTKNLRIKIACQDNLGAVVAGASVSMSLINTSGGSWTGTASTGSDGTVTFQLRNAPSGHYETTITNVLASGLTWDGITPPNWFDKT